LVLKIVKMALETAHKVACLKMISITSAGIYTGAALYVNFVEFPGLLEMDDAARGHQAFMHVFKRASKFMPAVILTATASAWGVYWYTGGCGQKNLWLRGAELMFLTLPYTKFIVFPKVRELSEEGALEKHDKEFLKERLALFNKLQYVRSALIGSAFMCFAYSLIFD